MGVFLATIDGSIVNISLPTLASSFQTDFALVQWVVLAYLLTVSTLMLGVGCLADIYGKKPIYTYVLRFLPVGLGVAMTRTLGQTTGIAILGALWAGQVFRHAGGVIAGGATAAPVPAQVFALRDTFVIVSILILTALLSSIWGLAEERKLKS